MSDGRKLAAALGLLAWVTVVLVAYYAVHKPVLGFAAATPGAGAGWQGLLTTLSDLLIAAWIVLATVGSGVAVLRRVGVAVLRRVGAVAEGSSAVPHRRASALVASTGSVNSADAFDGAQATAPASSSNPPPKNLHALEDPLAVLVFGGALGVAVLAAGAFALAAAQFLTPLWVMGWLGVLTGVAVMEVRTGPLAACCRAMAAAARAAQPRPVRALQAALGLLFLLVLTRALLPPTAWDSLVYHLTAPRAYLAAGGYQPGLDISHAYFPSLVEQLFTVALAAGSEAVPAVLHVFVAVLGVAGVWGFLRPRLGQAGAAIGVGVLVSVASLATLAGEAYVDWGVVTFGFLAFWALEQAHAGDSRRWLVLSGVLAGMAMGSKYTGLYPVAGLGWLLVWGAAHRFAHQPVRTFPRWPDVLLWGVIAAATVGPWLLRDLVLTGNPVYPFVFDGANWDAWKSAWVTRPGAGLAAEPLRMLAAPWEVTVIGREGGLYDASLGPLLLGLLPLALLATKRDAWSGRALAVAAFGYCGWLAGAAQTSLLMQGRLLLPVAPFLAVAVAAGWQRAVSLDLPSLRITRLLAMVTALVVASTLAMQAAAWVADPPLPVLAGAESRSVYSLRKLGGYAAMVSEVNRLPSEARILFLWEPRTYLCDPPGPPAHARCQADALLFNWRHLLYTWHDDPAAVAGALRAEGYTHLLVYGGGLRFFSEPPNVEAEPAHIQALLALLERSAALVAGTPLGETLALPARAAAGRGYALYALTGVGG